MPPSKRHRKQLANYRFLVARDSRELRPLVGVDRLKSPVRYPGIFERAGHQGGRLPRSPTRRP